MGKSSRELVEKLKAFYIAGYNKYRDAVLSGERLASKAEIQKVQRQQRDLDEGVDGYIWDWDKAVKPLIWISLNLGFPMGRKRGERFKLEPFQAFDVMCVFGWIKEDNPRERRFLDVYYQIARKNGKSTLWGAVLDYLAFSEAHGVTCYIGATSLDQAEETFKRAADALAVKHRDVRFSNSKNYKCIKARDGRILGITGAPKDGKLSYATIIDEYHQHPSNALIDSVASGDVSDQASLMIRVTTAGTDLNGVCHEEYEKCKRVLSREDVLERYFVAIYELDDDDDISDMETWQKANPGWGVMIDKDKLYAKYENAKLSATSMDTFKTKNLDIWVHSLTSWANMPIWFERCRTPFEEKALIGRVAYGALDLASNSDFTAFTLDIPDGGIHKQVSHFWIPGNRKDQIAYQCRIPVDRWIEAGWITATPGDVIDYDYVVDYITQVYGEYYIPYIAADKWKLEELRKLMPPWFEDVAYEFSQGMKTMSPSIKDFEKTYIEGHLTDGGNEVIDWMMSCCEAFTDSNENIKLVKPKREKTASRIDGVITSIMALNTAKTFDVGSIGNEAMSNIVAFF